jgi:hypothetical protein
LKSDVCEEVEKKELQSVDENQEAKGRKHSIKTKRLTKFHRSSGLRPFKGDDKKYTKEHKEHKNLRHEF